MNRVQALVLSAMASIPLWAWAIADLAMHVLGIQHGH